MQCCEDKMAEKNLNFKDFLANADLFGYSLTIHVETVVMLSRKNPTE